MKLLLTFIIITFLTLLLTLGEHWSFSYTSDAFFGSPIIVQFLGYVGQLGFGAMLILAVLPHPVEWKRVALLVSLLIGCTFWFVIMVPGYGAGICMRAMFEIEPLGLGVVLLSLWEALFLVLVFEIVVRADNKMRTAFILFLVVESWFAIEALMRAYLNWYTVVFLALRICAVLSFAYLWAKFQRRTTPERLISRGTPNPKSTLAG